MEKEEGERKTWKNSIPKPLFNPWRRSRPQSRQHGGIRFQSLNQFGRFDEFLPRNRDLDWNTKRAALDASPFVACLTSYVGAQRLFICSGIIINSYKASNADEFIATILTSASLISCPQTQDVPTHDIKVDVYLHDCSLYEGEILCYDFHYNVAAVRIKSDIQLQTAVIGNLDNYTDSHVRIGDSHAFELVPHRDISSRLIKLYPGLAVIALGQYYEYPYHIMAAPGKLRPEECGFDCGELVMADSEITKNGIGGPIIDYNGCVIGLNFYKPARTPFLPINIALKCLEHLLKYKTCPRPWLGLKISDLEKVGFPELENLAHNLPDDLSGVLVKEVKLESPASDARICINDIIIEIDGKHVENSLKFSSVLLDKAKEPFQVIVKRGSSMAPLPPLPITIIPQNTENQNRWPIPEECRLRIRC